MQGEKENIAHYNTRSKICNSAKENLSKTHAEGVVDYKSNATYVQYILILLITETKLADRTSTISYKVIKIDTNIVLHEDECAHFIESRGKRFTINI